MGPPTVSLMVGTAKEEFERLDAGDNQKVKASHWLTALSGHPLNVRVQVRTATTQSAHILTSGTAYCLQKVTKAVILAKLL